jgi:nucleoside 2-deoxyribosyltransferase
MEEKPKTCFVIQVFDGQKFDRRYDETFAPAVLSIGVKPIRADKILGLNPIIEKIEAAIAQTDICLCDVSTDNPNVWLELGYALATNKPTVIICDSAMRDRLPFDIQHRPVIFFRSDSKSGYEQLEIKIKEAILAELSDVGVKTKFSKEIKETETRELDEFEIEIIGVLVSQWDGENGGTPRHQIEEHMKKVGFNELSVGLGLSSLFKRGLIEKSQRLVHGWNNETDTQDIYVLNDKGIEWVENNRNLFTTKISKTKKTPTVISAAPPPAEDDLPF